MERGLHESALSPMCVSVGGEKPVAEEELHAQMSTSASEKAIVRDENILHEIGVRRQEERCAYDVDAGEIAIVARDLAHEPEPVGIQSKDELAREAAAGAWRESRFTR
jgi:hypothetical protein